MLEFMYGWSLDGSDDQLLLDRMIDQRLELRGYRKQSCAGFHGSMYVLEHTVFDLPAALYVNGTNVFLIALAPLPRNFPHISGK